MKNVFLWLCMIWLWVGISESNMPSWEPVNNKVCSEIRIYQRKKLIKDEFDSQIFEIPDFFRDSLPFSRLSEIPSSFEFDKKNLFSWLDKVEVLMFLLCSIFDLNCEIIYGWTEFLSMHWIECPSERNHTDTHQMNKTKKNSDPITSFIIHSP